MKPFPKRIYVTRSEDDVLTEYFVEEDINRITAEEDEGTEVAVYELVKVGAVKISRRVAFEYEHEAILEKE